MCVIIDNRNGVDIPNRTLNRLAATNPDGFGVIDLESGQVIRSLSKTGVLERMKDINRYIAHFRYTTAGATDIGNVHPFKTKHGWLMMNGTVPLNVTRGRSDTNELSEVVSSLPIGKVESFLSLFRVRFLLWGFDGRVIKTGKWHDHNGVSFSKPVRFEGYSVRYSDVIQTDDYDLEADMRQEQQLRFGGRYNAY